MSAAEAFDVDGRNPDGYIIAGTVAIVQPKMQADWDGEVHRSLDTAIESLRECHGIGTDREGLHDYHLYAMFRVPAGITGEPS